MAGMNQQATVSKRRLGKSPAGQFMFRFGQPVARGILKFSRENILQPNFQFHENCFQFIQRQMMLAVFEAEQSLVRDARLFRKFSVGKTAPFFSQEFCQLLVQVALHALNVAKTA